MAATIEQVVLELKTDTRAVRQGLDEVVARLKNAKTAAKDSQGGFSALEGQWAKLAAAFSAGALIDRAVSGIVSLGKSAIESAGRLVDLSDATGLSIEAVQLYSAVAKQAGSDVETYASAIFKLGVNISKGGDAFEATLSRLGISYRQLRDLAPEEQFELIARRLKAVGNENDRNKYGTELFGKTWKEIAPGVVAGLDDIKAATVITGEAQVRAIEAAGDAWDQFVGNAEANTREFIGNAVIGFQLVADLIPQMFDQAFSVLPPAVRAMLNAGLAAAWPTVFGSSRHFDPKTLTSELPADVKDLLDQIFGTGDKKKGRKGSDEVADFTKKVAALADQLSDKKLKDDLKALVAAIAEVGGVSKIAADQLPDVVKKIEAFQKANLPLPKVLQDVIDRENALELEQMDLFGSDVSRRANEFVRTLHFGTQTLEQDAEILRGIKSSMAGWTDWVIRMPPWAAPRVGTSAIVPGGRSVSFPAPPSEAVEAWEKYDALIQLGVDLLGEFGDSSNKTWRDAVKAIAIGVKAIEAYTIAVKAQDKAQKQAAMSASAMSAYAYVFTRLYEAYREQRDLQDQFADIAQELTAAGYTQLEQMQMMQQILRENREAAEEFSRGNPVPALQLVLDEIHGRQRQVTDDLTHLTSALDLFGGHAPHALQPYIAALLRSNRLTEEQRHLLEQMQSAPTWQELQQHAEELGISVASLGNAFRQLKDNQLAKEYFARFTEFSDLIGSGDMTGVYTGMADEIQALLNDAFNGVSLPSFLKPIIEQMMDLHLLVDALGNPLTTLAGITFNDVRSPIEEAVDWLQKMYDTLGDIRDALFGYKPPPINAGGGGGDDLHPIHLLPEGPTPIRPGLGPLDDSGAAALRASRSLEAMGNRPAGGYYANAPTMPESTLELGTRSPVIVKQYTGNAQIVLGNRVVGDVVIEDLLRRLENNDGGGAPVGPTTRLAVALKRAA